MQLVRRHLPHRTRMRSGRTCHHCSRTRRGVAPRSRSFARTCTGDISHSTTSASRCTDGNGSVSSLTSSSRRLVRSRRSKVRLRVLPHPLQMLAIVFNASGCGTNTRLSGAQVMLRCYASSRSPAPIQRSTASGSGCHPRLSTPTSTLAIWRH